MICELITFRRFDSSALVTNHSLSLEDAVVEGEVLGISVHAVAAVVDLRNGGLEVDVAQSTTQIRALGSECRFDVGRRALGRPCTVLGDDAASRVAHSPGVAMGCGDKRRKKDKEVDELHLVKLGLAVIALGKRLDECLLVAVSVGCQLSYCQKRLRSGSDETAKFK